MVARTYPDGRWRAYGYDDLVARDKASLDIFWLRDESLDDAASLEDPDVIAAEIIEDLQTALDEMALIYSDLAGVTAGKDDRLGIVVGQCLA